MTPHPWAGGQVRPVRPGPVLAEPPERLPRRQPRRITQLCGSAEGIHALCSDGTVWFLSGDVWLPEPPIPQRQLAED